jgi:hypothetical protein
MPESDELLTVAEIAADLKMNQQTIRNWILIRDSGLDPLSRLPGYADLVPPKPCWLGNLARRGFG